MSSSNSAIIPESSSSIASGAGRKRSHSELKDARTLVKAKVTEKSKLKPHNSFDAGFWESGPDLAGEWEEKSKIEVEQLQLKPFKGTPWEKCLEAAELIAKMKAHALEKRLCQDQAKRLKLQPGDTLRSMR
jgi:hypothetical protein